MLRIWILLCMLSVSFTTFIVVIGGQPAWLFAGVSWSVFFYLKIEFEIRGLIVSFKILEGLCDKYIIK